MFFFSKLLAKLNSRKCFSRQERIAKFFGCSAKNSNLNEYSRGFGNNFPLCFKQKFPFDVVDFSPLYRNLHMNQILNNKSEFANYYRRQREKQLKLTLQAPNNMVFSLSSIFKCFLY